MITILISRKLARLLPSVCLPCFLIGQSIDLRIKPVLLPIELTWSSRQGWQVEFRAIKIPTPIASFSVGLSFAQAKQKFPSNRILAVVVGEQTHVYDLAQTRFIIELPNDLKGRATLEYENYCIYLRIPNPDPRTPYKEIIKETSRTSAPLRFWHPKWVRELNRNPIVPGEGAAGVKLGYSQEMIYKVLGHSIGGPLPNKALINGSLVLIDYSLIYRFGSIFMSITLSKDDRTAWFIRIGDEKFNKNGLVSTTPNGLTIGSAESEIRQKMGEPVRIEHHFTVPKGMKDRRASSLYYDGIIFQICEVNKKVFMIDIR